MFPIASNSDDEPLYSDSVFSTYLYTGAGSTQTINNGIDLAGKGGLVWVKSRNNASASTGHALFDTVRGRSYGLATQTTDAQIGPSAGGSDLVSFDSNGFTVGGNNSWAINVGNTYATWTFRKAAKFFDIVAWTGDGNTYPATRTLNHSLGIAPGMIVIKVTSAVDDWVVYHAGLPSPTATYLRLNTTEAVRSGTIIDQVTSTSFRITDQLAYGADSLNQLNQTYVAYVFAHDTSATGFIQCGSYTGNGSATGPSISLGWEPQYLMIKNATGTGSWQIIDNMRGMSVGAADATLQSNATTVETSVDYVSPTATGFQITSTSAEVNTNAATYIYMAIRRPTKPPTTGTQVYTGVLHPSSSAMAFSAGFPPDLVISMTRSAGAYPNDWYDRLRGIGNPPTGAAMPFITSTSAAAETNTGPYFYMGQDGFAVNLGWSDTDVIQMFKRAPGFFDIVCDTGDGTTLKATPHNLSVVPELIIRKPRSESNSWWVYHSSLANINSYLILQSTQAQTSNPTAALWGGTLPTSSNFYVGYGSTNYDNKSTITYVNYLFATLAGISKVGSYTGNGSSQTINCGFAAGARFVLIKCTSAVGDWYVWDTARGITTGSNDPHTSMNTNVAEVTTDNSIDAATNGFIVNQVAATNINVTSATYIFLAIA